jgi:hypothetical protein
VCPKGAAVLVTVIGPLVADAGTVAVIVVDEVWVTDEAATPWKLTAELELNPRPWMVTGVPGGPLAGVNDVTDSVGENAVALVVVPPSVVTVIFATLAPLGAVTVICVPVVEVVGAGTEPNCTAAPCRFVPVIVTKVLPATPLDGEKLVIVGASVEPVIATVRCSVEALAEPVESATLSETVYVPAL